MSGYPSEWHSSIEPKDETGEAVFHVDGKQYRMRLYSFTDFTIVSKMLEVAFGQGKRFAAVAMASDIKRAITKSVSDHSL